MGEPKRVRSSAGCSKRSSSKAAGEEKPQAYPLRYVEDFSDPRTPLEAFFNILLSLEPPLHRQDEQHQGRQWREEKRHDPDSEILSADARLVEHPHADPKDETDIVQDDPPRRVHFQSTGIAGRNLEEKDYEQNGKRA